MFTSESTTLERNGSAWHNAIGSTVPPESCVRCTRPALTTVNPTQPTQSGSSRARLCAIRDMWPLQCPLPRPAGSTPGCSSGSVSPSSRRPLGRCSRGEQSKLRYTDNAACATMPAPKLAARRLQPLTMLLSNNASGSLPTMPLQMTMPQPTLLEHSR